MSACDPLGNDFITELVDDLIADGCGDRKMSTTDDRPAPAPPVAASEEVKVNTSATGLRTVNASDIIESESGKAGLAKSKALFERIGAVSEEPEAIGVGLFKNGWHVTTERTGLRWRVVIQPIDSEDDALDAAMFVCNALEDLGDANDPELIEALRKSIEYDGELRELKVEPAPAEPVEPLEMCLCEASAVVLQPRTYRFVVDPHCELCKKAAIDATDFGVPTVSTHPRERERRWRRSRP